MKGEAHHGWMYAVIAFTLAALVLAGMAVFQFVTTRPSSPTVTVTSAVPAEYAGISIPQAMRLSDTVVSSVPAQYAGVSIPQAMRLSDG